MQSMTLEQLRTANETGGVAGVTLKGRGSAFFVQITTRSGVGAVLAKVRSSEPRRFGNPAAAFNVLRDIGITLGRFDASEWDPAEHEPASRANGRAEALRKAHKAAAYNEWLAVEIQAAIDDPGSSIPHDEVMDRMDARIARHNASGYRIVWRPMAEADLDSIIDYIARDNPTSAKAFGQELRDKTLPLANNPLMGHTGR